MWERVCARACEGEREGEGVGVVGGVGVETGAEVGVGGEDMTSGVGGVGGTDGVAWSEEMAPEEALLVGGAGERQPLVAGATAIIAGAGGAVAAADSAAADPSAAGLGGGDGDGRSSPQTGGGAVIGGGTGSGISGGGGGGGGGGGSGGGGGGRRRRRRSAAVRQAARSAGGTRKAGQSRGAEAEETLDVGEKDAAMEVDGMEGGGGMLEGGMVDEPAEDVCEEDDEGNVEYKLKLVDPPLDRLEHLFTQVRTFVCSFVWSSRIALLNTIDEVLAHDNNLLKTGNRCIMQLAKMSIGPKFVELTADVVGIFL